MNKYYAASCSHLLGGSVGVLGPGCQSREIRIAPESPQKTLPKAGVSLQGWPEQRAWPGTGLGGWTGGLGWALGRGLSQGFGLVSAAARGPLSLARASLFCMYKTMSKQQNPLI